MTGAFETSRGTRIVYDAAGDGPPVLAVHGVGGGAYFFAGVGERLGGARRVIAVDLPGTGRSEAAPGRVSMTAWVADLGEFAASLGAPVALVGHSLGTIVALHAWAAWPGLIDRIVFVGGVPEVRPFIRERLTARLAAIGQGTLDGWGPKVSPGVFAAAAFHDRPEVVGLFERLFESQPAAPYLRSLEILLGASATAIVPTVTVPCLSVSGAEDLYAPPDLVAAFVGALPGTPAMQVLPAVGHLPFFEDPAGFAAAIGPFLST